MGIYHIMNRDIIKKTIREYLNESQGRSGFLYEQFSKLVKMLRSDYANKEIEDASDVYLAHGFSFYIDNQKELLSLLEPYITSKINVRLKGEHEFFIKKFDGNGNIIEIVHYYYNEYVDKPLKRIIKLNKPLDLFGYFLNKRSKEYYDKLYMFASNYFPFIKNETLDFAANIYDLIDSTKNTGDELSRDDLSLRDDIDSNKPYKYCWEEDYYDDEEERVKTFRRCEYNLPGNKRISVKGKEI